MFMMGQVLLMGHCSDDHYGLSFTSCPPTLSGQSHEERRSQEPKIGSSQYTSQDGVYHMGEKDNFTYICHLSLKGMLDYTKKDGCYAAAH
jgi:hypothetical protein